MTTEIDRADPNRELIARISREVCPNALRVILFGSRARRGHDKYSDYDVLVVIPSEPRDTDALALATEIRTRLAERLVPADVIVKRQDAVDRSSRCCWTVIHDALLEGVDL